MADIVMRKTSGGMRPVDDAGAELLQGIGEDDLVMVTIKRPRNIQHHRKFFALLNLILDNSEDWKTTDQILTMIKIALGHVETMIFADGRVAYVPKSISFASMSQDDFRAFWDRSCNLVIERFLPGVSRQDLETQIAEIVGIGPIHRGR